jgi:hypothetical protein
MYDKDIMKVETSEILGMKFEYLFKRIKVK